VSPSVQCVACVSCECVACVSVPWLAGVSFLWTVILSLMRGEGTTTTTTTTTTVRQDDKSRSAELQNRMVKHGDSNDSVLSLLSTMDNEAREYQMGFAI